MKNDKIRKPIVGDIAVAAMIVAILLALLGLMYDFNHQIIDIWKISVATQRDLDHLKQRVDEQAITLKTLQGQPSSKSNQLSDKLREKKK